ncbi:SDR family NAD(P)-dependent oxidoreductase [Halobaculum limi]|uniref:SDR family NAD(P)-dependent oxidoreductase n=1 Tax=Halobaculum limi TaxID=3031916 RepID=UPI00240706A1|nr:SDR family NAD(P)-dependent oxidoreductase [Halobaculum sp. YSMS11]
MLARAVSSFVDARRRPGGPAPDGSGLVVVVTGANEGIGHHILRTLLEDGYRVACLDVDGSNVEPLAEDCPDRVAVYECDVTVDADVTRAVDAVIDEWGHIDVLVNNAAVFEFGPFEETSLEQIRREFEVNYFGYVRLIRAVLPHMTARGGGIVHNVSSGAGVTGHPSLSGYASTKGAVEALARSLRLELAPKNVAVTLMHPSLAATRSASRIGYPAAAMNDPADVGRGLAKQIRSTDRVIYADWGARVGIPLVRLVPAINRWATRRFVPSADDAEETPSAAASTRK